MDDEWNQNNNYKASMRGIQVGQAKQQTFWNVLSKGEIAAMWKKDVRSERERVPVAQWEIDTMVAIII